jgi:4-amino-4-deoxy-L-arabinose transferase-like glycosyltransferase
VVRRIDVVFLLIVVVALGLRLNLATTEPFIHDEENTSIPLSRTISFSPGALNFPIRGENHGALPAYVVKASSAMFGTTPLGYRLLHVLLGICTVAVVYLLTRQWYGVPAARWAAALLAFNEYFLAISSRATAHVPHLLFVALAFFAFSRFLRTPQPVYLYAAGASVGFAFYCKEHSALLLPVFFAMLMHARHRHWLRRPHPYLAALLFALMITPDIYWNLTTDRDIARVPYTGQAVGYATYGSHLDRIGGIGLSPYPSMFYARNQVKALHRQVTGTEPIDETAEYRSMNPALGLLLLGIVLLTTFRPVARDDLRRFLLLAFWGVFGFFTLIAKGNPPGRLDPASWIWVENTMFPAAILAGARLACATAAWRVSAWALAGAAVMWAIVPPGAIDTGLREVQAAIDAGRHTIQYVVISTVAAVRTRPLYAVGLALTVGILIGSLVGFFSGWLARGRQRKAAETSPMLGSYVHRPEP